MGKVRRLASLLGQKDFFLRMGATFIAIFGVVAAVLSVTGNSVHLLTVGVLMLAVFFISALFHLDELNVPQVIVDDILEADIDRALRTKLRCPADEGVIIEAKRLASHCFAGSVSTDPATYDSLRVKNPYILSCLTGPTGEFLGYFDVIPVKDAFAKPFIGGLITESQLTHEHVLGPDEMKRCKFLFVSGLAALAPKTHIGRRSASILVWALLKYLDHYYGSAKPLVFAVAAKPPGEGLLKRFMLKLSQRKSARADGYNLYTLQFSREHISRRLACLPDWSQLCILDWSKSQFSHRRRADERIRAALPTRNARASLVSRKKMAP